MSQPQPIITEEPQPQAPIGFQQPLPGQYPQEYSPPAQPAQPMMQPAQPAQQMMQPAQPAQPMMQPAHPAQPMMQPAQPAQQMMQPAQPAQPMMQPAQPAQPMMQPAHPAQPMMQPAQPAQQMMQPTQPVQPMMQPAHPAQPMMQPIQMQPLQQSSTTTNVVMINQQPTAPPPLREWSTGVCGCFEDCGTCCYGLCCGVILLADISQRLGEGRCLACCGSSAHLSLRVKFRTEQRIQGSLWDDYIAVYCCGDLALCQLARELDYVQSSQRQ